MEDFEQQNINMLLTIRLDRSGNMAKMKFDLKDVQYSNPIFRNLFFGNKLIIPVPIVESLIRFLTEGDPLYLPYRVEFRDPDRSYMIFYNSGEKLIIRSFNLITDHIAEFEFEELNKRALAEYLLRKLSSQ